MQILKISGANIASLGSPFEIDLSSEPLRSAGLFAITGETGAGKSSILDAMCLALYGDCPRLKAEGVNDHLPEVGEVITAKDPRSILRRGSSEGYALVEFEAPDGKVYQAHWSARRARGKIDGRLQNVERHLKRMEDDVILENQVKPMNARMVELTGLTFDQFCRTVLLAQGDFDAFLKADTNERAALLEKVTGTGVYRDVSRRIFDFHAKSQQDLSDLELRQGEQKVLSEEGRDALIEEREKLQSRLETLQINHNSSTADIKIHEGILEARTRAAKAAERQETALKAKDGADAQRRHLDRLELAADLRSAFDARMHAEKVHADLLAKQAQVAIETNNALKECDLALRERDKALEAYEAAERIFKDFGPDWSRATTLDGQIITADRELTAAGQIHAQKEKACQGLKGDLEKLRSERKGAEDRLEDAVRSIALRPRAEELLPRKEELFRLLGDYGDETSLVATQSSLADDARKNVDILSRSLEVCQEMDDGDRQRMAAMDSRMMTLSGMLQKIAEKTPSSRMLRLEEGDTALSAMLSAAREHMALMERKGKEHLAREAATRTLGESEARNKALQPEIARHRIELSSMENPLSLAEAAASDAASALRHELQEGEPCPVCGSRAHPSHEGSALAALVVQLREDKIRKQEGLQSLEEELSQVERRIDRAGSEIESRSEVITTLIQEIDAKAEVFAGAREKAQMSGLKGLPETPDVAVDALVELRRKIDERRSTLKSLIAEEVKLSAERDSLLKEKEQLQLSLDTRQKDKDKKQRELSDVKGALSLAVSCADAALGRAARCREQLEPLLALVEIDIDAIDTGVQHLKLEVSEILSDREAQCKVRDLAMAGIKDITSRIEATEMALALAERDLQAAADQLQARKDERETLQSERSGLLGGESTESHRTRHNTARTQARSLHERSAAAATSASTRLSAAETRRKGIEEDIGLAHEQLDDRTAVFLEGCRFKGLEPDEVGVLLQDAPRHILQLREHLRKLDDEVTAARANLIGRHQDLQEREARGIPEKGLEELRSDLKAMEVEQREGQGRIGEIGQILATDDLAIKAIEGLEKDIAKARSSADTWSAVNEAVGSRTGSKFVQIAQAVTLSVLVDRANLHLEDLKPRYQLMQGGDDLSLKIIDRDMGDEIRSTRSLSGGERFLISLSLALALSRMGSHGGLAATLFIDEGFGSLDAQSLDMAIDALEALQAQGRTVGVISHVEAMKDRIPVQIKVSQRGNGSSLVELA